MCVCIIIRMFIVKVRGAFIGAYRVMPKPAYSPKAH